MNHLITKTIEKKDFLLLFNRIQPNSIIKDYNGIKCIAPLVDLHKLDKCDDFTKQLFILSGISDKQIYNKFYNSEYWNIADFLALWTYGFRDLNVINSVIEADKKHSFSEVVYKDGIFADYCENEKYENIDLSNEQLRKDGKIQTCFSFIKKPWLYDQVNVLLQNTSEQNAGFLISEFLQHPRKMIVRKNLFYKKYKRVYIFDYLIGLIECSSKDLIDDFIIPNIKKNGLTKKVYDKILNKITEGLDDCEFPSRYEKINYSSAELQLEWEYKDYKFLLPKKYGFAYKLNNKIFSPSNEDIDVDVSDRDTTELYVKKGLKYKYIFEIVEWEETGFELCNITTKNNKALSNDEIELISIWCKTKNVIFNLEQFLENNEY